MTDTFDERSFDLDSLTRLPVEDLQPHVVVQFDEEVQLPYEPGVESLLEERDVAPWGRLVRNFGDVRLVPLFTVLDPGEMRELQARAAQIDPSYKPTALTRFWRVAVPAETDLDALAKTIGAWRRVTTAYVDRPAPDPTVTPLDDPRSANQIYLDPAPDGIDAEYAWGFPGGAGAGQRLIDLERGWTFDHEDLVAQSPSLLHGDIRDGSRSHGTSVLGEICASDNALGCIGIAPEIGSVDCVSYWNSTRPDALLAAITNLDFGEVLLLEAQVVVPNATTTLYGPIEVLDADYEMIRLATALGIIVVEAGGNGTNNGGAPALAMDTYTNTAGDRILWRDSSNPDFRDSGAIIVTAATSSTPHLRRNYGPHGARIDCYAWSQNVDTLASNTTGATNLYTTGFSGTSSASPIVAGAALLVQGIAEQSLGFKFSPAQMREILSDPTTNTLPSAAETTAIGVMPDLRQIIDNVLNVAPDVYIRDNTIDVGDPHTGAISASPDIIVRPTAVANPQAAFGAGSGTENSSTLGRTVEAGQDNFVYTRMLNRGGSDATDVKATVFWSPASTLVTPDLWTLVGDVVIPNVTTGNVLTVSDAITWPSADVPPTGHYCFVGIIGNAQDPAPNPTDFLNFDNFRSFIRNNNNVTWRNFNVVDNEPSTGDSDDPVALEFLMPGAPDKARKMSLEVVARLPRGARIWLDLPATLAERFAERDLSALPPFNRDFSLDLDLRTTITRDIDVAGRLGRSNGVRRSVRAVDFSGLELDRVTDLQRVLDAQDLPDLKAAPKPGRGRSIVAVNPHGVHRFRDALFGAKARNQLKLLVHIPKQERAKSFQVFARQLFEGEEVGRVTWQLSPKGER